MFLLFILYVEPLLLHFGGRGYRWGCLQGRPGEEQALSALSPQQPGPGRQQTAVMGTKIDLFAGGMGLDVNTVKRSRACMQPPRSATAERQVWQTRHLPPTHPTGFWRFG